MRIISMRRLREFWRVHTLAERPLRAWYMQVSQAEWRSFSELLTTFLPRVITSEDEYDVVQAKVDQLIDKSELTTAEQEYLNLLGTLIWDYETRMESQPVYELRGVALLKGLLELHNLKQQDLVPVFKTKSIVSDVLSGKRQLTVEHINKLAAFFNVAHEIFFEPIEFDFTSN